MTTIQQNQEGKSVILNKFGKPLYSSQAEEVAFTNHCVQMKARFSNLHRQNLCCDELSVLSQKITGNYTVHMESTARRLKETCTRRICSSSYMHAWLHFRQQQGRKVSFHVTQFSLVKTC